MKKNCKNFLRVVFVATAICGFAVYLSYAFSYYTNFLENITKKEMFSLWLISTAGLTCLNIFHPTRQQILFGVAVSTLMYYVMYFVIGCSVFKDCI